MFISTFWGKYFSTANMFDVSTIFFPFLRHKSELKAPWATFMIVDDYVGTLRWIVGTVEWMDEVSACVVEDVSHGTCTRLRFALITSLPYAYTTPPYYRLRRRCHGLQFLKAVALSN